MFKIVTFIIFIWNIFFLDIAYGLTKSCSGHDACKNNEWSIYDTIKCRTGERVCKNTKLTCPEGSACSIVTSGSGHDNYQNSFVFAEKADSFTLTCGATGQRGCQNNKIWCPTKKGATCTCSGCKISTKLFCTYGNTCSGGTVENLNQAYCTGTESQMWCQKDECSIVQCPSGQTKCASIKGTTNTHFSMTCKCPNNVYEIPRCPNYYNEYTDNYAPDLWTYDKDHKGQKPICPKADVKTASYSYLWGTLQSCKNKCLNDPKGLCNVISRYGENVKTAEDLYHCWFYACPDPSNVTWVTQDQWGNGANECNSYFMNYRRYIPNTCTFFENKTIINYINVTNNINAAKPLEDFCINSRTYYNLPKSSNVEFQKKSWKVGCQKRKETLSECYSACNSPKGCCGLTCASNSCSGGGCCDASKNICKKACDFYFSPKSFDTIINYINQTRYNNLTRYNNITRYINVTVYNNVTRYQDIINYLNVIRYFNKTINITKYNNITRYQDIINYLDVIRYINKTINITNYNNITQYLNFIRYINQTINITRYNDVIRYVNKTNLIPKIIYQFNNVSYHSLQSLCKVNSSNQTKFNYINKTFYRYINKTVDRYTNKTIYRYINKTIYRYKNISVYYPLYVYINKTKYNIINKTNYHLINKTRFNIVNITNNLYLLSNKSSNNQVVNNPSYNMIYDNPKPRQNSTICEQENMNFLVLIGFYIILGISLILVIFILFRCYWKEMIENSCCYQCGSCLKCCKEALFEEDSSSNKRKKNSNRRGKNNNGNVELNTIRIVERIDHEGNKKTLFHI